MELTDGLKSLYFESSSPNDLSGNGFHLTPTGITYDGNRIVGSAAAAFDGNDYGKRTSYNVLNYDDPWTVSFWLYPRNLGGALNETLLHLTNGSSNRIFTVSIHNTDSNQLNVSRYLNNIAYAKDTSIALVQDTYQLVVIRYAGGVGGTPTIGINNVDRTSAPAAFFGGFPDNDVLYVGQRGNGLYSDVLLNQIATWDREITAPEETQLYGGGAGFKLGPEILLLKTLGRGLNRGLGRGL